MNSQRLTDVQALAIRYELYVLTRRQLTERIGRKR